MKGTGEQNDKDGQGGGKMSGQVKTRNAKAGRKTK